MQARLPNKIRFDAWTLDTQSGDLTKGEVTTRLQIQPLQILLALLENPGNLVSREQLIARLWPKGIVEFDTSLNTAVRKLRIALSDDSDNPRFIDTIPRRGYRFIAKIEPEQPATPPVAETHAGISVAPRPSRARFLIPAALLLIVVAAGVFYFNWNARTSFSTPALVVLPMVDMSAEHKDAALCLAVTEAISNRLSQLPTIHVVSRTMAMKYDGKNEDVREIGKSLGATYVVESSVRRDQKALRGTVQLVSATDGYHLYSQSFDFAVEDLQEIEQTLSQSVAQAVRLLLSPELVRQSQARRAHSYEAFGYFVRARKYGHEGTPDGDDQAAALYRLAIERDPQFALAYVGLAETLLGTISSREAQVTDIAEEVTRLLADAEKLNADMPELFAVRGWLAIERKAYPEAEKFLRDAVSRNPFDAVSYGRLGNLYEAAGRPRDALESYTRAAELDPLYFIHQMYRCMMLQDLGQYDEAARSCARTRMLARDNFWGALTTSWLDYGRGDLSEALRWSGEAAALEPSQSFIAFYRVDLMLTLRLVEQARAAAREIVTTDEARLQEMRASLELAEHGPAGLRAYLEDAGTAALSNPNARIYAVRFYHVAGDLKKAGEALNALRAAPDFRESDLYNAMDVRFAYSPALICAGLLLAKGDQVEGLRLLDGVDAMLARLEQNGWAGHGLDALRAESLALRGQSDAAMRSLKRAVSRGWRGAWRAQTDPYLSALWQREDFRSLMKEVEARNADMRARFLRVNPLSGRSPVSPRKPS
jgi:TolB-like protein/DNA-binding winged helix-turn-helix (wHTH) protein